MEKPKKSASEAKAERKRTFVVERERRVVEMKLLKPRRNLRELIRRHRVDSAKDSRVDVLETGKRFRRAKLRRRHRIADLDLARVLHSADDVADLPCLEMVDRLLRRGENADFVNGSRDMAPHEHDALPRLQRAVHHADIGYHTAELVEHRVEDKRPKRCIYAERRGRRYAVDDCLKNLGAAHAGLRRDEKRVVHRNRENVLDLARDFLDVGAWKVHLVENRNDLELRVLREVCVRNGLRLDALCGVDYEKRPFARTHRAADLIGEVDMAGRIE